MVPTRLLVDGQLSSPFRSSKKQRFALPGLVKLQTNFDHRKAISKNFGRYMHGGPHLPGEIYCCANSQNSKVCKSWNLAWTSGQWEVVCPSRPGTREKNHRVISSFQRRKIFLSTKYFYSPQSKRLARKRLFLRFSVSHCVKYV